MKFTENPERARILTQALSARTLSEITVATEELERWVRDNPDDRGIVDAFEQLAIMQEIAQDKEAEQAHPAPEKQAV